MAILTGSNLSQSYGADDLFGEINLEVQSKDRVGLVGPNGSGKTSLLRILAGLQPPTSGEVQRQQGLTLGYLRQEAVLTFAGQAHSIYQEMLTVFAGLRTQEAELRRLEAEMAAEVVTQAVLDEYGRRQEEYELAGGYQYPVDIKRVLLGLGFEQSQWETPLTHLSGGQKTRLLLGRLLLENPALLILDEPTNHLDMSALEWLERSLRQWPGALIIVSHDRYFLDKIITRVWEIGPSGLKSYRGNYTSYASQRQLEWEREKQLFEAEKTRLEKEVEFIRKHIAGGKADIAKGKLKRLTRDITLMEQAGPGESLTELRNRSWLEVGGRVRTWSINEADTRLRDLKSPWHVRPRLNIRLQAERRSGRIVLRTGELEIGYPENLLFRSDRIRLERLDCAALIGPNGSGKSTFLKTVEGKLPTLKGWLKYGDSLRTGYFAQGHEQLNFEHRLIDEVMAQSDMSEAAARNYLAQYMFREDDVFKRVASLSGGERGRLALSLLALNGANFLLLDEPTNHLDIPSQEVLQAVLEAFDGTILMVSHDRYLIDRLATQIWELRDGYLHVFKGSYQEYLMSRDSESDDFIELTETSEGFSPPADLAWVEGLSVPPVGKQRQSWRQRRLEEVVLEIEDAEAWLEKIDDEMEEAKMQQDEAWLSQLRDEAVVLQHRLAALSAEWDELAS